MFGKIIGGFVVARGIATASKALKAKWVPVKGKLLSPERKPVGTLTCKVPMDAKGHPTTDEVLWGVFWAAHGFQNSFLFEIDGLIHEVYGPRHPERLKTGTVSCHNATPM